MSSTSLINNPSVIVDTDCGWDDLASLIFLIHFKYKIELITTVTGMQTSYDGAATIRGLFYNLGYGDSIPVVVGSSKPLSGGRSLKDVDWYQEYLQEMLRVTGAFKTITREDEPEIGAKLLVEKIEQSPGIHTVLCLGPLTNIAKAIQMNPNFANNVKHLIIMGGAISVHGNMTLEDGITTAELNFWIDPSAASIVLNAPFPKISLLPLDGCHPLSSFEIDNLINLPPLKSSLTRYGIFQKLLTHSRGAAIEYDTISVYYLVQPDAFKCTFDNFVKVNDKTGACTKSNINNGKVTIIMKVDHNQYYDMIADMITEKQTSCCVLV